MSLFGSTFSILSKRIGEGGATFGVEVRRVQQLLVRTGHNPINNIDGGWGKKDSKTVKAWMAYQESKGWTPNPYVDPIDAEDRLGTLAEDAGVLMTVPQNLRSQSAVTSFTDSCISNQLPYGWFEEGGGTLTIWGFENRPNKIIFTNDGRTNRDFRAFGIQRSVNCCSYVNLMLSIWSQGNAHAQPYDASQIVGGAGTPVSTRFGLPELLNSKKEPGFDSLDEVKSTIQPGRIYHMSICIGQTLNTRHDLVVVNDTVYQANKKQYSPNGFGVYTRTLDQQWGKKTKVRLFGPGPF